MISGDDAAFFQPFNAGGDGGEDKKTFCARYFKGYLAFSCNSEIIFLSILSIKINLR